MTYLVNVTARAERDLMLLFDTINAERSDVAHKWYSGLREAILSLEEQPNRCRKRQRIPNSAICCMAISHTFTVSSTASSRAVGR